jgi:hypothetical protein
MILGWPPVFESDLGGGPSITYLGGAHSGAVVEALRYKPEGRASNSRWCHWNFSLT